MKRISIGKMQPAILRLRSVKLKNPDYLSRYSYTHWKKRHVTSGGLSDPCVIAYHARLIFRGESGWIKLLRHLY